MDSEGKKSISADDDIARVLSLSEMPSLNALASDTNVRKECIQRSRDIVGAGHKMSASIHFAFYPWRQDTTSLFA